MGPAYRGPKITVGTLLLVLSVPLCLCGNRVVKFVWIFARQNFLEVGSKFARVFLRSNFLFYIRKRSPPVLQESSWVRFDYLRSIIFNGDCGMNLLNKNYNGIIIRLLHNGNSVITFCRVDQNSVGFFAIHNI